MPIGQFGTRVFGGNDSASGRYIFTKLSPITKFIFQPEDEHILTYLYDNNQQIEPQWYAPIIPMILVNGCEGIGTGWKTSIPNFNPLDIIENLKLLINGQDPVPMIPWFRNFHGAITEIAPNKYLTKGCIKQVSSDRFEITELPVRVWTQSYKETAINSFLNAKNGVVKKFEDHYTDIDVKFLVHINSTKFKKLKHRDLLSFLRLQKTFSTEQMVLFDEHHRIKRFNTAEEILSHFFKVRLAIYAKRKFYIENFLVAEFSKLENQLRFILENIEGTLNLRNLTEKNLIDLLKSRNFVSDPIKKWTAFSDRSKNLNEKYHDDNERNDEELENDFNYLLSMPLKSLVRDNFESLNSTYQKKLVQLTNIKEKSPEDLWLDDLEVLKNQIEILYKRSL